MLTLTNNIIRAYSVMRQDAFFVNSLKPLFQLFAAVWMQQALTPAPNDAFHCGDTCNLWTLQVKHLKFNHHTH